MSAFSGPASHTFLDAPRVPNSESSHGAAGKRETRTAPGPVGDAVRNAVDGMRGFGTPRPAPPPLPMPPDPSAWPRFKVPPPPSRPLSGSQIGQIERRADKLMQSRQLTHKERCLLQTLLKRCRSVGQDIADVGYRDLCKLVALSNDTVSRGLKTLVRLGLIEKHTRRAKASWHQGGERSFLLKNLYRLLPPAEAGRAAENPAKHCESGDWSMYTKTESLFVLRQKEGEPGAASKARETLENTRKRREAERAAEWKAKQAAKRAEGRFAAG